jgi:hypothetical protein
MSTQYNQYQLPINDTLKTAWHLTYGAKGTIWAALGALFLCWIGVYVLQMLLVHFPAFIVVSIMVIAQLVLSLIQAGIFYLGIHRAFGLPIRYSVIFDTLNADLAWKIFGLYILQMVIFLITFLIFGLLFFISTYSLLPPIIHKIILVLGSITYIYLIIKMILSLPYVLDKKINPWQAIKLSFEATKGNVLPLIAIYFMQIVIFIISAIPLGIGLIWTIPFMIILYGVIYKRLSMRAD